MKYETRICKIHGETLYRQETTGRWRCVKCSSEAVQKRRDRLKELAVEYTGGNCVICGYNKCIAALEFHHLDSSLKDFGIGYKGYTRSWECVKKELDKCILVCANCHREIHSGLIDISLVKKPDYIDPTIKPEQIKTIQARATKCPTKEELNILVSKYTNSEIGRQLDVSETAVRKWRRKLGI